MAVSWRGRVRPSSLCRCIAIARPGSIVLEGPIGPFMDRATYSTPNALNTASTGSE